MKVKNSPVMYAACESGLIAIHSPWPVPESAPAAIIWLTLSLADQDWQTDGFIPIDDVLAHYERDEQSQKAMERARRRVGQLFYSGPEGRLTGYRLAKGWSQRRLAQEVGIGENELSQIERRQGDPRMSTVRRLCRILGIGLDDFLAAWLSDK